MAQGAVPPDLQHSRPDQSGSPDSLNEAAAEPCDQECATSGYSDEFEPVRYEGTVSPHSRPAQF